VIKGEISILKESMNRLVDKEKDNSDYEIPTKLLSSKTIDLRNEILRVKQGGSFGEMSIIQRGARNASAASAFGNVDLFYLDTEAFHLSFGLSIARSIEEKKNFIQNLCPISNSNKTERNYLNIVPKVINYLEIYHF